jgi:hypothetical protein
VSLCHNRYGGKDIQISMLQMWTRPGIYRPGHEKVPERRQDDDKGKLMSFEEWMNEIQSFSPRSEKIFKELVLEAEPNPANQLENITNWIRSAYEAGANEKRKRRAR